ncbi:DUF4007 family protein [Phocaeicola plebeius]|jgi:hypothetical protein|uniref:DUF4007 family protein n=1 Tax=Phocaeicola plebeius TaxID=310297 RepID=UPI0026F116C3|nr:DUF4007 family protein [Phocaeicola plebeius]
MNIKYTFSGHESFPCKSLWLKKGYDFVKRERNFNAPDTVIDLGVGKNMVSSIRFWLKSFGLYDGKDLSELADYLFDEVAGRDKYMEDLATLWLLHFMIVTSDEATLYDWLFRGLQKERKEFDRAQVLSYVKRRLLEDNKYSLFNENTVKKDIGVLLLNYVIPQKASSNEDYSSLLLDLDLIRMDSDNNKVYFFNIEGKRQVTPEIFFYGLVKLKGEERTVPYELLQELGLIFCMSDLETINMLKYIAEKYSNFVNYSDVAGIRQMQFIQDIDPMMVLNNYYDNADI